MNLFCTFIKQHILIIESVLHYITIKPDGSSNVTFSILRFKISTEIENK